MLDAFILPQVKKLDGLVVESRILSENLTRVLRTAPGIWWSLGQCTENLCSIHAT
jgi:hypothetical protein